MNHRCRLLSSTLPPAAGAICGKSGDPFGFQSARRLDCIGEPKRRKRRPQALSRALGLSVDDPPPSVHKAGIARGNPIGDHIQTRTRAASLCSSASSNCSPKSPGIRAAIRSLTPPIIEFRALMARPHSVRSSATRRSYGGRFESSRAASLPDPAARHRPVYTTSNRPRR